MYGFRIRVHGIRDYGECGPRSSGLFSGLGVYASFGDAEGPGGNRRYNSMAACPSSLCYSLRAYFN